MANKPEEGQLDYVASSLVQEGIVKNKDKDVRLLAACCLADIVRIYAPDCPYNTQQTKDAFSLLIDQLKGLEKPDSSSFQRQFYILERLSSVEGFILLTQNDEFEGLLFDLFQAFFSIVQALGQETKEKEKEKEKEKKKKGKDKKSAAPAAPSKDATVITTKILESMTSCIDELEIVSPQLLISILDKLGKEKVSITPVFKKAQTFFFCYKRMKILLATNLHAN